jgi:hypothetical protein
MGFAMFWYYWFPYEEKAYKVKFRLGEYALQDPPLRNSTDASYIVKGLASQDDVPKIKTVLFE